MSKTIVKSMRCITLVIKSRNMYPPPPPSSPSPPFFPFSPFLFSFFSFFFSLPFPPEFGTLAGLDSSAVNWYACRWGREIQSLSSVGLAVYRISSM